MMIYDSHIHVLSSNFNREEFHARMKNAGITGGMVISLPPGNFVAYWQGMSEQERLDNLFFWTEGNPNLYPFHWIDPLQDAIEESVHHALERGIVGFKIICNSYYPGDPRAMNAYKIIAETGKPLLFHSGILWDGCNSSKYNRPAEFEALLEIPHLRFALAHVSWPWCDECIAVFGKIAHAQRHRNDVTCQMFLDISPGTPPIYRKDVITKIFSSGYDVEDWLLFGSDLKTHDYSEEWVTGWMQRDNSIYEELGVNEEVQQKIYCDNFFRFLGLDKPK